MKTSFFFILLFVAICNNVLYANTVEKKRTSGTEEYHTLKRVRHGEHVKLLDEAHDYMVKQNGGELPPKVNLQPLRLALSHKTSKHTEDLIDLRMGNKLPGTKTAEHFHQKKPVRYEASGNEEYHTLKRARHREHLQLVDEAHNDMVKQNGGVAPVNLQPPRLRLGQKISKHTQDLFDLRMGNKLPGTKTAEHFHQKKLVRYEASKNKQ